MNSGKHTPSISLEGIEEANKKIRKNFESTPLKRNLNFSTKYQADIYFKREDLQRVRSYKIRGAYNKISSLSKNELSNGILCASAGNHAQGVAFSCEKLKVRGKIFMPVTTPNQKVDMVKMFGKNWVEIILIGDTYDDAYIASKDEQERSGGVFIHPFNDQKIIEGQATVGLEILKQFKDGKPDVIIIPVGGGGLISGVGGYIKSIYPDIEIWGVEPKGAPSMSTSLNHGKVVKLESIDKFVDGASVKKVGSLNFEIAKNTIDKMYTVHEGKVCETILKMYNEEAIVVEPAGALTIAILDKIKPQIKDKKVVCIISGGNNDITRTAEISERALLYSGLKHYFIIRFPQRPGSLRQFLNEVLGPEDDITHFDYQKKDYKNQAPVIIGIELKDKRDFSLITKRMEILGYYYEYINDNPDLYQLIKK